MTAVTFIGGSFNHKAQRDSISVTTTLDCLNLNFYKNKNALMILPLHVTSYEVLTPGSKSTSACL